MPIHYACQNGNYDIVKLLIDKGGDVDAQVSFLFFS